MVVTKNGRKLYKVGDIAIMKDGSKHLIVGGIKKGTYLNGDYLCKMSSSKIAEIIPNCSDCSKIPIEWVNVGSRKKSVRRAFNHTRYTMDTTERLKTVRSLGI